ncbi:hypothetical protein QMK17_16985 [Rhodococcus sp. G-MC3]|uniref:hypothetical protein n=1 Tax=Rhodococcus sp. G-MC3 TaxID=3046209 RepID=UPI0024B9CCC8|nr:hypothetical protein [Rhodococcus sp. G-MC3]MDJ0395021.1 hypothetical protein [Rhodococcus sp. G-MC3]
MTWQSRARRHPHIDNHHPSVNGWNQLRIFDVQVNRGTWTGEERVDDHEVHASELQFSEALGILANASESFKQAIDISSNEQDSLKTSWAGESATAHFNRWSEFVDVARTLTGELDLDHSRLSAVIQSVITTEHESAVKTSLLDLS